VVIGLVTNAHNGLDEPLDITEKLVSNKERKSAVIHNLNSFENK